MGLVAHRPRKGLVTTSVAVVGAIALTVAIIASTTFVSASEKSADQGLDVGSFVDDELPGIEQYVQKNAHKIGTVAKELSDDPAAAKDLGVESGTGKFAIPVSVTGTVKTVDETGITVTVRGLPKGPPVLLATAAAVNGSAIRDVTGEFKFSDFATQSEYQQVSNRFKAVVLKRIAGKRPAKGSRVDTIGIFVTGGPDDLLVVTPLTAATKPPT